MKIRYFPYVTSVVTALGMYAITTLCADAQVEVTVNGSAVDIYPVPIVQAGRVFVPLRGVFEQLGASVVYSNGTIDATGNGRDISLQIGSTQATINGQPQTIDVAPFIVGASTYVPLRFISEALGDSVNWDDANSIAAIDTGGGSATYFSPGTASYVDTPPPPIPDYQQSYVPQPNDIWQPGYWAWGSYGYYWVPGTWVAPPQSGYLWTPGYWQASNSGFNWNPGYWALQVGFYGGVNYGGGYFGRGYDGGQWSNGHFRYNTYVTRVNTTNITNVYVNRNVYVNDSTHVSYSGGPRGVQAQPTSVQLAVARGHHLGMTAIQRQHLQVSEQDRSLLATVNGNKPPVLAVTRPFSQVNRPAGFVPVKPTDRVNPQANVAPVRLPASATAIRGAASAAHAMAAVPHAAVSAAQVAAPVHKTATPPHVAAFAAHAVAPAAPVRVPAVHAAPQVHAKAVHAAPVPPVRVPAVHSAPPPVHVRAVHAASAPAAHAAPPPHHTPAAPPKDEKPRT